MLESEVEIRSRLEQVSSRLQLLSKQLRQQMALPLTVRDQVLIAFMRDEIDRYKPQHQSMLWLLGDPPLTDDDPLYGICSTASALAADARKFERIEVYLHGGLGDVLCFTPALRTLKQDSEQPPDISLYVQSERAACLFEGNPNIDQLIVKPEIPPTLAAHEYALSVGSLGTDIHFREPAANILASALGLKLNNIKPELYLSEAEKAAATQFANQHKPLVLIAATSRQPANQDWPIERWQEVIKAFPDYQFAQLGLPDEPPIENIVDLRAEGQLRESLAIVAIAKTIIGMDTLWGHAAAAFEVPSVVMFGGTHPSVFGYPSTHTVYREPTCSPCHHRLRSRACPYDTECINDIGAGDIISALRISVLN